MNVDYLKTKSTMKRALVLGGLFLCSITEGYIFGQMSGMVAAMKIDEELGLTEDDISWIASTIHLTSLCGFIIAGILTETLGRKRAISILTFPIVANWVLLYYANNFLSFLLSRVIVGICFGGVLLLVFVCTSEYTSPNIRGFYLNMVTTVGPTLGTIMGHILSVVLPWRTVALLGLIPTLASAVLPLFWVESPSWLASKGRFDECRKAFYYLHGHGGEEVEKELGILIDTEKFKNNKLSKNPQSARHQFKIIKHALSQRYFWNLSVLYGIINLYRVAAGKIQYNTLAINMLQDITGQTEILLFTIYTDLFFLIGSFLCCYLIRKMKMLTLLFSSACVANVILLLLSAGIYFQSGSSYFPWINTSLLALYLVSITAGPYPVIEALLAEVAPIEIKSLMLFSSSILTAIALVLSFKLLGPMSQEIGYHGVFLLNVVLMSICLVYFKYRLPETKGKTLQEIELFVKTGSFEKGQQSLDLEQMEELRH